MNKSTTNRSRLILARKELILNWLFLPFLFFSLSLLAASCGQGNLSKTEATNQLRSKFVKCYDERTFEYNLESDGLFHFLSNEAGQDILSKNDFTNIINENDLNTVTNFEKAGFITTKLIKSNRDSPGIYIHYYSVALTEKGKIFISYEEEESNMYYGGKVIKLTVNIQQFENIEILGIGEPAAMSGKKVSAVKYRASWKQTALGKELNIAPKNKEGEAMFVLYDTGWKIESL